jgi:putative hemolysin
VAESVVAAPVRIVAFAVFAAILVALLIGFAVATPLSTLGSGAAGLAFLLALFLGVAGAAGATAWMRRQGPPSPPPVTEAEIRRILGQGAEQGAIDQTERALMEGVLRFTDTQVRKVMVPRPQMVAISVHWPAEETYRFLAENKFSRYPVYDNGINDIIGFLNYKDVMTTLREGKPLDVRSVVRPAFFVPETMRLSTLFKELQRRHLEFAVVVNEHGNVEGLVTLEDVLEQIVGEIRDEYDVEERRIERQKDGSWVMDASLVVEDLPPDLTKLIPPGEGYQTVAGFVLATLGRFPRAGESWEVQGYRLTALEVVGRRIAKVKIEKK